MKENIFMKIFGWTLSIILIPSILVVGGVLPEYQNLLPYCDNALTFIEFFYWFVCFTCILFIFVGDANHEAYKKAVTQIKKDSSRISNKLSLVNSMVAAILLAVIVGDISFVISIITFRTLAYHIKNTEIKEFKNG